MDLTLINSKILQVFIDRDIKTFPVDPFQLLESYNIKIYTYSELKEKNEALHDMCINYSDDAFRYEGIVCYNEQKTINRIRFSLAHELGHIVLGHLSDEKEKEVEANYFASNFLSPRMAIHYANCKNVNDVAKIFKLSEQASRNAFDDYRRWRRNISAYGMSTIDKQMYEHFYNEDAQKFVWTFEHCDFCFTNYAYNGNELCDSCKLHEIKKNISSKEVDYQERDLDIARSRWLYGNL